MSSRATPERSVQISVIRWLRLVLPPGSVVCAIKNEEQSRSEDPMARARFQMARKASGVVSGIPDLLACIPGGRSLFCEVKAPGGVVSAAQQRVHFALRALAHTVIVADSIESARAGLIAVGIVLREAAGQPVANPRVRYERSRAVIEDTVPF